MEDIQQAHAEKSHSEQEEFSTILPPFFLDQKKRYNYGSQPTRSFQSGVQPFIDQQPLGPKGIQDHN